MVNDRKMISVPAELRRRMGKVRGDVNWSAIACQAFEAKLAEMKTPEWQQPSLQLFENGCAMDELRTVADWVDDCNLALGMLMTNCKEYRHDDPGFRAWYQEIRDTAFAVSQAMDELKRVCTRYTER